MQSELVIRSLAKVINNGEEKQEATPLPPAASGGTLKRIDEKNILARDLLFGQWDEDVTVDWACAMDSRVEAFTYKSSAIAS